MWSMVAYRSDTASTRSADCPAVAEGRRNVFQGKLPASTLIVVKSLYHPDCLMAVEGVTAIG
jgi:hypothetical protein